MEEELLHQEFKLARLMKDNYCNERVGKYFKETEPAKAAEILYKIGMIYGLKSPDKISLIKSVGLINAAIVRNPSNVLRIKSDLNQICLHILKQANAKNQNADLIYQASYIKSLFNCLRNDVKAYLNSRDAQKIPFTAKNEKLKQLKLKKIQVIRFLNQKVANKYKQIMKTLSQFCENVMGKPPCEYAIVGMGSLARNEITPYSDFEHIILLFDHKHYKAHLEYFRWYSVIFHTVVLNIQETIVPSLHINSLNDKNSMLGDWYFDAHTPRGISFDGMMPHACKFPLGRTQHTKNKAFETELIKPVREMLQYLSSEADLKNGYHLADILTKTCFVFGNENIFKQFEKSVKEYRNKRSKLQRIANVEQQVKDDLNNFSTRFCLANLKSSATINIKQLVYRSSTLFISALASIYNISCNSCFDIINDMIKIKAITKFTGNKLNYAVAIACEIRLRNYMKNESQCDHFDIDSIQIVESANNFLDIVGAQSMISYFQIAYCLQCEVAKQLNLTKIHFYSDPLLINIAIGLAFGISNLKSNVSSDSFQIARDMREFNFDACIEQLEATRNASNATNTKNKTMDLDIMESLAYQLYQKKIYDESLEFNMQILQRNKIELKDKSSVHNQSCNVAYALNIVDNCLMSMQRCKDDTISLKQSLKLHQNILTDDRNVAHINNNIGLSLKYMQKITNTLLHMKQSLEIVHNISLDHRTDYGTARILNNIGLCFMSMQEYANALTYLKQSLEIYQKTSSDLRHDPDFATALNNVGLCLISRQEYNDALTYLKQSLVIRQNTSHDQRNDSSVAHTLNNIGLCLKAMQQYNDALIRFKQSLEIHQNASLDCRNDSDVASTLNNIGLCLMDKQKYKDALDHLKQSLEIKQNALLDHRYNCDVAGSLNNIGICLQYMQKHNDALNYLKQSLEIKQNVSLDLLRDSGIAGTLYNIGLCLMIKRKYNDALNYLKQALQIRQRTLLNHTNDCDIAGMLNSVGLCLMNTQNYDKALVYLKQSFEIYQNTSLHQQNNHNFADTLTNIGLCLQYMQKHNDALVYLEQSLEFHQNASLDHRNNRYVAGRLKNIGLCLMDMKKYNNALICLKQSLKIYQTASLDHWKDRDVAGMLNNVGMCLMNMQKYNDALIYLEQSLEIYQNTSLHQQFDCDVAHTLVNIGLCLMSMQKYHDALTYLKRSLKIYQNTSLDEQNDREIADTLYNLSLLCCMSTQKYNTALIYLKQSLEIYQNTLLDHRKDRDVARTLSIIRACWAYWATNRNSPP